jgi:hypothetical protein
MAGTDRGFYFNGQDRISCRIKRRGAHNTRIVLDDGKEILVPSESVTKEARLTSTDTERLIPTIPLETFYRSLRKLRGSKEEQFRSLFKLLNERYGPKGAEFLGELFRRSVRHAESYANIEEKFYSTRSTRSSSESEFAKLLVRKMSNNKEIRLEGYTLQFVDYEIFPFRTTYSCNENGEPGSHMGSGGMDMLLASTKDAVLPAIGEIKAGTETVGPTFALVQSLMYAAQMATSKQFSRLEQHYGWAFDKLSEHEPKVDVIVFLEPHEKLYRKDLEYALSLSEEVGRILSKYVRQIAFVSCSIVDDAISCKVEKAK